MDWGLGLVPLATLLHANESAFTIIDLRNIPKRAYILKGFEMCICLMSEHRENTEDCIGLHFVIAMNSRAALFDILHV